MHTLLLLLHLFEEVLGVLFMALDQFLIVLDFMCLFFITPTHQRDEVLLRRNRGLLLVENVRELKIQAGLVCEQLLDFVLGLYRPVVLLSDIFNLIVSNGDL